ncbi:MAG: hypothetical protein PQJ50_07480 [Spirochaetales bacterium]|nr:hypothetical protein [Spirochaetales bacterium]
MNSLCLPEDLKEYLKALDTIKDFKTSEAGRFSLNKLDDLLLHRVPSILDDAEFLKGDDVEYGHPDDPHHGQEGCYMVKGVNLIKDCVDYDPFGLLLWLPDFKRYGIWDSSHFVLFAFDESVSWTDIVKEMEEYIDAGWNMDFRFSSLLLPWPVSPYQDEMEYSPIAVVEEGAES